MLCSFIHLFVVIQMVPRSRLTQPGVLTLLTAFGRKAQAGQFLSEVLSFCSSVKVFSFVVESECLAPYVVKRAINMVTVLPYGNSLPPASVFVSYDPICKR